jgi:hypothetical protein
MQNSIKYTIYKEHGLVISWYSGIIGIPDIREHLIKLSCDPDYSPEFDEIHDFRFCEFSFETSALKTGTVNFLRDELKIAARRKVIFLTTKPKQVVMTTLFSKIIGELPMLLQVYSTTRAASKYLNKNEINEKWLDTMILKLEESAS